MALRDDMRFFAPAFGRSLQVEHNSWEFLDAPTDRGWCGLTVSGSLNSIGTSAANVTVSCKLKSPRSR